MSLIQTIEVLEALGQDVVQNVRRGLLKQRTATSYETSWGPNHEIRSYRTRRFKKRIANTGALFRSFDAQVTIDQGANLQIEALDYAEIVNDGRRPGNWVPVRELLEWVRRKKALRRDIPDRQLQFLINRKIFGHGIEGTGFLDEAIQRALNRHQSRIFDAIGEDLTLDSFEALNNLQPINISL